MALKEAVEEALNRGISQVIFESDSKSVVEALVSRRVDLSEFSSIIAHIKSLVTLAPNFEVKFVKRQANTVAYHLARAAYSLASRYIFESIPRCIELFLINEMN
jgi:ribonuclease HI